MKIFNHKLEKKIVTLHCVRVYGVCVCLTVDKLAGIQSRSSSFHCHRTINKIHD